MAAINQGLAMRILLATAAILFAVTAAQAQSANPAANDQAVQNIVEKLKASRAVKSDVKPSEVAPAEAKPVEAAKPVEPKPADVKPVPTEAKPAETKPVESKPVEQKPVEAKPVEAKLEKKRVVAKTRESREQTARRIAEKYGFHLELE